MAPHCAALHALLLVLALANIHLSSSHLVKASVSCLDCGPHKDLSGMRLAVKCRNERKFVYALTNRKGFFKAEILTKSSRPSSSPNCLVMLLGGPMQLWSFKKSLVSKIKKARGSEDSYGLSTPLAFFTSYTSKADLRRNADEKIPQFGISASPTNFPPMGFPPPANWTDTLPLIFLFPFLPIIGIP